MNQEKQLFDLIKDQHPDLRCIKIDNPISLRKICQLFFNNIIDDNDDDVKAIEAYYYGLYYEFVAINYTSMVHYYKLASNSFNHCFARTESLFRLGIFWYPSRTEGYCKNHFEMAKKYFWEAFCKGHQIASAWLGDMVEEFCTPEQFRLYLDHAVEHGSHYAMRMLALQYGIIEKNFDKMIALYSRAIDGGDMRAIDLLKAFCEFDDMDFAKGDNLPIIEGDFNDTVLIIIMKYQESFKRKEIINCLRSVFVNQERVENENVYRCLVEFKFVKRDKGCVELRKLQKKLLNPPNEKKRRTSVELPTEEIKKRKIDDLWLC